MNFTLDDVKGLIEEALEDRPTGDPFLDARYAETARQRGEPLYYYRFFYLLARKLRPHFSVELGGWQATAAAHLAAGNPLGVVVTIDHHSDPGDEVHKAKTLEAVQHYQNLLYFQGWTWDKRVDVQAIGKPVDFLFIDSWHNYEYARRDWNDYSPLLADVALVVCDDIMPGEGPVIAGMDRFWAELPGEKFLEERLHYVEAGSDPMGILRYTR